MMLTKIRGTCNEKADCGRACTLSDREHTWHICQKEDCLVCHPPHDVAERWTDGEAAVRARVDRMDVWTLVLALGGLAGLWMGGIL